MNNQHLKLHFKSAFKFHNNASETRYFGHSVLSLPDDNTGLKVGEWTCRVGEFVGAAGLLLLAATAASGLVKMPVLTIANDQH